MHMHNGYKKDYSYDDQERDYYEYYHHLFQQLDNITIQEQMEWTREIELTSTDKCKTIKNGKNLVEAKKTNLLTLLTVISHIW
ncbi:MAG: hypothetical protein WBQ25_15510 [Nitrososphaeraceae archaeon]|jgi:hypothetical protein